MLEGALKIIADTGVEAVTHRRIAEVTGLPLASTTYWFESKDELLTAALELAAGRDIARLRAFAARTVGHNEALENAIASILGATEKFVETNRGSLMAAYALLLEAARRPALQRVARGWTDAYRDTVGSLLARAGSQHPAADAELLLAAADGLLLGQLASGDVASLGPRLRRLAQALIEAP